MSKFKEIGGATINYGLGKFIPQIIGFLLIPVYTAYLSPEDYGIVELCASFTGLVIIFMRMALPGSVSRFYFEHKEGAELRNYVTTVYWTLIWLSVVVGVITMVICYFFLDVLVPGLPFWPYILLLVITMMLNTNGDVQKRLIQARKQSRYSAILSIVTSLISIATALIMVIVFDMKSLGFVIAGLLGAIFFFIQSQFYLSKDLGGAFSFQLLKPSLKYALNIVPSHLVTPLSNLFGRALLSNYSLAAVGTFSLANRFLLPLTLLAEAFNTSYGPIYFEARKSGDPGAIQKLNKTLNNIWIVTMAIFIGACLFFPPAVKFLTPVSYHEASNLIPYLAVCFPFGVFTYFVQVEVFFSKNTHWVSVYAVIKMIVNLLGAYFLVRFFGVYGLVFNQVLDGMYAAIFWTTISHKLHPLKLNLSLILKASVIGIGLVAGGLLFNAAISNLYWQFVFAASSFAIFVAYCFFMKWVNISSIRNLLGLK